MLLTERVTYGVIHQVCIHPVQGSNNSVSYCYVVFLCSFSSVISLCVIILSEVALLIFSYTN